MTALALAPGCAPTEKAPIARPDPSKPLPLSRIAPADLPRLGEPIGPLDADRIEVAAPENWIVLPRQPGRVIRFKESDTQSYPGLSITSQDWPGLSTVSRDDVGEFAKQVSAALQDDPKVSKLSEPIQPVEIGSLVGVTHGRRGKDAKGRIVERQFLETVVAGRRYTLELQTLTGTLDRYRPYLHAVAAGIKFLKVPAPQAEPARPPDVKTPETEPAKAPEAQRAKAPDVKTPTVRPAKAPEPAKPEPKREEDADTKKLEAELEAELDK